MSMGESYWIVRIEYYETLAPNRVVERREYARSALVAAAMSAAREHNVSDIQNVTVDPESPLTPTPSEVES